MILYTNSKETFFTINDCKKFIEENIKDFKKFTPELNDRLGKFIEENDRLEKKKFKPYLLRIVNNTDKKVNSNSLNYWIGRGYTEEEAKENISSIQRKRSKRCKEFWIGRGYTEEEAKDLVSEHQKKSFSTFKSKHSDDELKILLSQNSCWNKEFWMKRGYTEEEAKNLVNKKQVENTNKIDYEKRISHFEIQYWVKKGFTEDEAKSILKENSDTRSLESHIRRNGEDLGYITFNDQTERFKETLSNFSQEKRNEINSKISKSMKEYVKTKPHQGQSKMGKIFCLKLYRKCLQYKIINSKNDFRCYANREKRLRNGEDNFLYDVCINDKVLIEYNGTPWHYDSNYKNELAWFWNKGHFISKMTKEICEQKDIAKKQLAESLDYKFFVVWDFQDMDKEIDKIIEEVKCPSKN